MRLWPGLIILLATCDCTICMAQAPRSSLPDHPIVLGFDRFFTKPGADKQRGGELLLGELHCIACHRGEGGLESRILTKQAPVLDGVGGRVQVSFLRAFLSDPQAAKPGTTMPNVLAPLPESERQAAVEALVHFLASTGTLVDIRPDAKSIAKGKTLFHQAGCVACHGPRGIQLKDEASVLPLGHLAKKYALLGLANFLHDPLKTRPSGRMPSLNLSGAEAHDIAHYLLADMSAAATFTVDAAQVNKGRSLFASMGCASCHSLHDGDTNIASTLKAPALAELNIGAGCLAEPIGAPHSTGRTPRYALNAAQRAALGVAIKVFSANGTLSQRPVSASESISRTLTTFHCYACHQRDSMGGVEFGVNEFFTTRQKEMGDEGRLPPHLNGVGGKLNTPYLQRVLAEGVKDRPYMFTRMPRFGMDNVGHLPAALAVADPVPAAPMPTFKVLDKKIKDEGRNMVGNRTFGCVKCHNFRDYKSGGIQGMDMTIMADRLRREWFTQYLLDPNKYRPGTRMPAVWPLGQSQLPKVLEGDTAQQIEAVWRYLADGPKAALPYGVVKELMPLIAQQAPIIYRNFIVGAGTRAIGVGFLEKINLAFDANDLRYALIWHKEFIDASKHWSGRGEGFQVPLGEGILALATGPTMAFLKNMDDPWPAKALKDQGYKFRGYHLGESQRPTFLYDLGNVHVEDLMVPMSDKDGEYFRRIVAIKTDRLPDNLWFRAAAGSEIRELTDGWYAVGNELKVRLQAPQPPVLRTSAGKMELLVPIRANETKIVQELVW